MKLQSEEEVRGRLAASVLEGRKRKQWTQQILAERSQLPRSYIADLEGARRNPSLRSLVRVSTALGVPVYVLLMDPAAQR